MKIEFIPRSYAKNFPPGGKAKKNLAAPLMIMLMFLFLSGSLFAEGAGTQNPKKGEFTLLGGGFLGDENSTYSLLFGAGLRFNKILDLEGSLAILGSEDVVFSGNLNLNLSEKGPFVIAGMGVCKDGRLFVNIGGGFRLKLKEKFGLRFESRFWGTGHGGGITLLGGFYYSI